MVENQIETETYTRQSKELTRNLLKDLPGLKTLHKGYEVCTMLVLYVFILLESDAFKFDKITHSPVTVSKQKQEDHVSRD